MEVQPLWLAGDKPPDLRLRQADAVLGEQRHERLAREDPAFGEQQPQTPLMT